MSKNLKDLIDALEEKNQAQSEFELNVRELREENERLKFTIKEQKLLIQEQKEKLSEPNKEPEDIQLLKEVITSQRQELNKKEKDIEILENRLEELKLNLDLSNLSEQNEALTEAQKIIIQLTEENELYRFNESSAKTLIEDLTKANQNYREENDNLKSQLENLEMNSLNVNYAGISYPDDSTVSRLQIQELKDKLIMLEQECERLSRELNTANITQDNLINEININLNEISDLGNEINEKNTKINVLNEKINSLTRQNAKLKDDLAKIQSIEESFQNDTPIRIDEDNQLNEIQQNLKNENLELKTTVKELKDKHLSIEKLKEDNINLNNVISALIQNQTQTDIDHCLPKTYQNNLFMRLYIILENQKKQMILDSLIQDLLNSKNHDIKRSIIHILSDLKDQKVYNALLKTIHDEDWAVRLFTIKSLYKFEFNDIKTYFIDSLKELRYDNDIDVREAAVNLLNKL